MHSKRRAEFRFRRPVDVEADRLVKGHGVRIGDDLDAGSALVARLRGYVFDEAARDPSPPEIGMDEQVIEFDTLAARRPRACESGYPPVCEMRDPRAPTTDQIIGQPQHLRMSEQCRAVTLIRQRCASKDLGQGSEIVLGRVPNENLAHRGAVCPVTVGSARSS